MFLFNLSVKKNFFVSLISEFFWKSGSKDWKIVYLIGIGPNYRSINSYYVLETVFFLFSYLKLPKTCKSKKKWINISKFLRLWTSCSTNFDPNGLKTDFFVISDLKLPLKIVLSLKNWKKFFRVFWDFGPHSRLTSARMDSKTIFSWSTTLN